MCIFKDEIKVHKEDVILIKRKLRQNKGQWYIVYSDPINRGGAALFTYVLDCFEIPWKETDEGIECPIARDELNKLFEKYDLLYKR